MGERKCDTCLDSLDVQVMAIGIMKREGIEILEAKRRVMVFLLMNGHHPCGKCHLIARARQTSTKSDMYRFNKYR